MIGDIILCSAAFKQCIKREPSKSISRYDVFFKKMPTEVFHNVMLYILDYGPASMGTATSATTAEKHFKTAFTTTAVVRMENGEFALTRVVYPAASNQCVSGICI